MRRGGLFHRLFLRFLGVLAVALLLLVAIVHRTQLRMIEGFREGVPSQPFPLGSTGEFALVVAVVLVVAALALYPFVRSLGRAFSRMTEVAGEVAGGSYGRTVGIERRDELGGLIAAFDEMSRRLAEGERLQARLLHDVSHELRSPLGRIQAFAETIEHRPEEAGECARGIEQEVALLDRLVGDLLATARLESAAVAPAFAEISLRTWAEETFRRLGPRARSRGIEWVARPPEEDRQVRADPQRLTQAVANLVDNAVAALEGRAPGRMPVQIEARIEVRVEAGEAEWSLTVTDDGPGIPPADLPHVFRRFYRVQEHRGRDGGGVGLGLSLVRAIAEAHGGTATIESPPAGMTAGTRVILRMPVARPGNRVNQPGEV